MTSFRRLSVILVVTAVGVGGAFFFLPDLTSAPAEQTYRVAKVDRGTILATVTATGTINPVTTVIVSSQLSGQVVEILADYNSQVSANQVVARLNSDQISARLDAARADLAQVRATRMVQEAQIERVKADTERARAAQADSEAQVARNEALLADSERGFQRQSELKTRGFAAEAAFDTARAQRDAQRAALDSSRAQLLSARAQIVGLAADLRVAQSQLTAVTAQVAQREALVRQIEVDLRNTEIKSPVSGVVVQRNVELGQTVAASLQAPTLFLIADDLHRMEIAANIDETDVGRIKPGQRVSFTVNAYPGRNFEGAVKQVRLGSQTVQNVVIYTTIISVENRRLELMPGMTANLRIDTERRDDVVRVPNAALRWRPPTLAPEAPATPGAAAEAPAGAGRAGGTGGGGRNVLAELAEAIKAEIKPTAAQQKEIDAAFADARAAFSGGAAGGDAAARRERFSAVRADLVARISATLEPSQRATLAEIGKRLAEAAGAPRGQTGRVFIVGPDGKPQGVTMRIGATDGSNTEVVTGLEAGRDVIVGGGPRAAGSAGTPAFGPRLF